MAERTRDMTVGGPAGHIFTFAIPLMVGNVFQQLYTMVDAAVVGRFVGIDALAAVGAADWLNWLVLGLATGFTQGYSIKISQQFGAGDHQGMRKTIAMSSLLAIIITLVTTLASQLAAMPVLKMLNTPENIMGQSLIYLRVCFGGLGAVMAYNLFASILRAMGDGRTPLVAMLVAALTNVVLDLLFVAVFHWGVGGAAIATVFSQILSGVYCFLVLRRFEFVRALNRADWQWDKELVRRLMGLGTPLALQNAIISAGGMAVQYVINGFGFIYVAGFTATNKLYGLLELACASFGHSLATFTGQNLGARKTERIWKGVHVGVLISLATSAVISLIMLVFGRTVLSMFIDPASAGAKEALDIAARYLRIMSIMLPTLYILHAYRASLHGMGDTLMPMVSGILELVMRVGAVFILPIFMGANGIFYAEPLAWLGADFVLLPAYYIRIAALRKSPPDMGARSA